MIFIFRTYALVICVFAYCSISASHWPYQVSTFFYNKSIIFFLTSKQNMVFYTIKKNISPRVKDTIYGSFFISKKKLLHNKYEQVLHHMWHIERITSAWNKIAHDSVFVLHDTLNQLHQKKDLVVRVLLKEVDKSVTEIWQFSSEQGFYVYIDGSSVQLKKNKMFCKEISLLIKNGSFFCNGKKVTDFLKLKSLCGYGEFNASVYDGDFVIFPYNGSVLCINYVALEDYITAVLKTESWPGWPLEVNKVFAIACRSYVLSKLLEAKKNKKPFHVKNTNVHQTYRGRHETYTLKRAVEETKGIVLGFNEKPILAMFDSCCGGVIPAHIADFDFSKVPYLARSYACDYCKVCSLYSWTVYYDQPEFELLMKKNNQLLPAIHDVFVAKKDKAGLVTEVKFKGPNSHSTVSGKKLYSLLKEVKSFNFTIHKKMGKIIITGRGFGHHLGLCQWGAHQMVLNGFDYKSILKFYYPHTYFMKVGMRIN